MAKAIQGKALETLRSIPMSSAMDAVRALDLSIKQERVIRGEPSERTAVDLEAITRKEMERWLVRDDGDGDEETTEED